MSIKIHKYSKSTLDMVEEAIILMSDSTGMIISHFVDLIRSAKDTLFFNIEGTSKYVTFIKDIEFPVSVRKKVNMVAVGPNEKVIKEVGKDIGKYDYKDKIATCPSDLPPGFEEIYK